MKKRFARLISVLLSILLALECVPLSTGSLYEAQAAGISGTPAVSVYEETGRKMHLQPQRWRTLMRMRPLFPMKT